MRGSVLQGRPRLAFVKLRDHHTSCHGFNPARPDGGEWAHAMVLHDGSTVYADSAAEVIAELLPGYDELDAKAKQDARARHAAKTAGLIQRLCIEQARVRGEFDPDEAQQSSLMQILTTDKALSLTLELPQAPGQPADWLPVVPLVLVTTSYAPHTGYQPIGGNVIWIDPVSEEGYLASLNRTGAFSYWTAAEDGGGS